MPFITSDQIRDISIKTVENFLNGKVPLSEGLAKYASDLNLNSEQIHRAVEATNSIAYLKVLSLADDRTMEFPLCKYAEVMETLSIPDTITKSASANDTGTDIFGFVRSKEVALEKVASETPAEPELNEAEKRVYFIKMAAQNKRDLGELRDKEMHLGPGLLKAASDFRKDPQGLEKLATVTNGAEFDKVTALVYGVPQKYTDDGIFKEADLKEAKALVGMLKQAEALVSEIKSREALDKKAELLKEAFIGAIGAGIGRAIGSTAAMAAKAVGKIGAPTVNNATNFAQRKTTQMGNVFRNMAGETPKPIPPKLPARKLTLGAVAAGAGAVAGDAIMYSPGVDKTTGRSKDVWTSLQREPNI
jgi:hypothetical protein